MSSAFLQPPMPGYSPWPGARQDTPFLRTPGVQGMQEGVAGGQGQAQTPMDEFFAGGTEGTAPPSSIAPGGAGMWARYGGSGGAPSSQAQMPIQNMAGTLQALRGPNAAA